MILKRIFDILASAIGLLLLCWVYPIVAILIKIYMPGPVLFCQKRVGMDGVLFTCHKFRTMTVNHNGSSVSVAGESRITPLGGFLRKYKLDELPELWDVLIGNMSFVGPRPDVPGYADCLVGDDRVVLKLRPGITGPATLKYRNEEELLASLSLSSDGMCVVDCMGNSYPIGGDFQKSELAIWYNDNVIYPDKVRLNKYYYEHYSFCKDIEMIVATVMGKRIWYNGEKV